MRFLPLRRSSGIAAALLAGCAGGISPSPVPPAAGGPASIPISVMKPAGAGPFPAVVMLHDCSGLGPRSSGAPRRWAELLVARGYVVAIPDSFSPRGFPNGVCVDPSPARVDVAPFRRVRDAYAALDHLRALPEVDGSRVGVMGGSHGGSTTLATLAALPADAPAFAERKRRGFAAGLALYPGCDIGNPRFDRGYRAVAPLRILSGELDDWTPAAPCEALARNASGAPVTVKVYPGAHHSFDSNAPVRFAPTRMNAHAPTGRGATTGGNPAAWADAREEVVAHFDRHLKGAAAR